MNISLSFITEANEIILWLGVTAKCRSLLKNCIRVTTDLNDLYLLPNLEKLNGKSDFGVY